MIDWSLYSPLETAHQGFKLCYLQYSPDTKGVESSVQYPDFGLSGELGKVGFIPSGTPVRRVYAPGRSRVLSCIVDPGFFMDAGGKDLEIDRSRLSNGLDLSNPRLPLILGRVADEIGRDSFAKQVIVEGLMHLAIGELLLSLQMPVTRRSRDGGLPAWRMRLIKERLHDDLSFPTIEELARLCKITPRHLMRAFKHETGETLGACISRAQIDRAKTMLRSDMTVASIADRIGFSSPSGFAQAFRRATDVSPTAYRIGV
jgi:AraC family transcriptional regulator